jgi:DNA-binding helix-hairpin-helix protein with protein kinase domain
VTTLLRAGSGATLSLGPKVGAGGEGVVFRLNEQPASVAKIYSQPLPARQVAKLQAMVAAADDPLQRVAAWPTELLYRGPTPVGFTMPLLTAQRPLHELLGPRSRQELFPGAQWSFLIHTARNIARAFAVLHERNVVVGDVNSNNIVICGDSTARLIDCDSFQFPVAGGVFRCNVGVADYQPPELQACSFDGIDRLPQHDRFGLAVAIFQLLFVGKHPFAGVLPPDVPGDGAIGANVAAKRYFYAPQARRHGLRPPPGSPTLAALTPEVAALFSRAFLGEPAARPTAADWETALADLENRVVRCARDPAHRHVGGTACPWCALARRGLHYFTLPGAPRESASLDESIWQHVSAADVERRWAEIAAVPPPAPVDPNVDSGRRWRRAPLRLWTNRRRAAYAAGGALLCVALAACVAAGRPLALVPVLAVALLLAALFRPDARAVVGRAWRRESEVRRAYAAALHEWQREARGVRFHEARARLAQVRHDLLDQRRRYDADVAAVERQRQGREWSAFLENRIIADWHLRQIDARTRYVLRSHGIVSAADVTRESLRRVPGLSRHTVLCLMVWRTNVENEFARRPRTALDERALHAVKLRHLRERANNWARLAGQADELRRLAREIEARRPQLRARARELAEAVAQAVADSDISPLFYKTWT